MAEHVRPGGTIDPNVMQELVVVLSEFGMRLPTDVVLLSRALVDRGRHAPRAQSRTFADGLGNGHDGVAGRRAHRRSQPARPRRAARRRTAPPPLARTRRPHPRPHRTRRAPRRAPSPTRTAGGSCARSSTGPSSASSARRSSPSRRCCSSRLTPDQWSLRERACSRSSATAGCSPEPCWSSASSPPSPGTARHDRRSRRARRPPCPRLLTGRPASATTATPATSSGCASGPRRRSCCSCSWSWRPSRATACVADLADAAGTVTLPLRQLLLAGVQVSALLVPIGVVAALVARRRWRRLGTLLIGALAGAAVVLVLDALHRRAGDRSRGRSAATHG